MSDQHSIQLYLSAEHDCSYLPGKVARTAFIDPNARLDTGLYSLLIDRGFRRSGNMVYKPLCDDCSSCVPVRVPAARFIPRRSHRRIWKKWDQVVTVEREARFIPEHFALYSRYLASRHPEGEMTGQSADQYMSFLGSSWCDTRFLEFRLADKLVALSTVDMLAGGMSAVYTCFDPDYSSMSPGVFAVLWQIRETHRRELPWVYLGFWVPGCQKMEYKSQYRPLQAYLNEQWREFSPNESIG